FSRLHAIHFAGGTTSEITQNDVNRTGDHGIYLSGGATHCSITENESHGNARPNVRAANGIHLIGCPFNVVARNSCYENQDSGIQINGGSNYTLSQQNQSWNNGDHGFDHLGSIGTVHVCDVAYHNYKDGFSFEGNAGGAVVFNCISIENGLT